MVSFFGSTTQTTCEPAASHAATFATAALRVSPGESTSAARSGAPSQNVLGRPSAGMAFAPDEGDVGARTVSGSISRQDEPCLGSADETEPMGRHVVREGRPQPHLDDPVVESRGGHPDQLPADERVPEAVARPPEQLVRRHCVLGDSHAVGLAGRSAYQVSCAPNFTKRASRMFTGTCHAGP